MRLTTNGLPPRLGRAIVQVEEDQLSLAIGRRGQNVRLASKLVGWDIEIMTPGELDESIARAEGWFSQIPGIPAETVETFIVEGFLSYDDLTFMEPAEMAELAGITEEQAEEMIEFAEESSERVEEEERIRKEQEAAEAAARPPEPAAPPKPAGPTAATIFGDDAAAQPEPQEAIPTVESLFGPENAVPEPAEPNSSADQVFGNPDVKPEEDKKE